MTDTHRCIGGSDCCRGEWHDGQRRPALTEKPHTLCPPCIERIENAVDDLPKDWANLAAALGERAAAAGQRISSTPTPAIPISTRKEALMRAIADRLDRAAAMVSNALHAEQPVPYKGRGYPEHIEQIVRKSAAITAPNIPVLAAAPTEPALIWAKPQRCQVHADLIALAEESAADPGPAYVLAGQCDECNGWGDWGQERELVLISGLDIAIELVELHNQARAELGLTRLRHTYEMPCPDCGAKVFRNDGESIVQCEGDAKHTCTEREYKVRAGLRLEEETWMDMRKYFLSESYWRLDRVQGLVDLLDNDPTIDTDPRSGRIILEHLKEILTAGPTVNGKPIGHQRPTQRASGTDRRAAMQRQVDEDNWTWRNKKPYERPTPKPRKKPEPVKNPIHEGSLNAELIDIDADTVLNGDARCRSCNLIHAGECW